MRATLIVATLAFAGLPAGSAPAFAAAPPSDAAAFAPGGEMAAPAGAGTAASPGLDLTQPTAEPARKPMVKQWWFWTAVGATVAASVLVLVLVDRGPPAPNTTLGNREFQP